MNARDQWVAVERRDPAADGAFVYAVRSTGIYCRPSCPSRRPRRDRVSFFDSGSAAERAGFRPCRRCQPDSPRPVSLVERALSALGQLSAAEGERVTLARLARRVGASPEHLQRAFRRDLGVSPRDLTDARRLQAFKRALKEGMSVTAATYEAGFGSSSRVYERAGRALGMTPGTYSRGGEGTTVRYACVPSSLGQVLVAATGRGVCAVKLGSDSTELVRLLREEFPNAHVIQAADSTHEWVSQVLRIAEGTASAAAGIPLDIRGSAFQWKVWKELQKIPAGETRSYGEIARRVGRPAAARAVARACATNPACLVIPCHRVVASDGALGGYHWGVARKRAILERERAPGIK
jgi:AraC family transcriptional regulator of adaptative response/methylated-DNA-[protein]-cysteine methyltransferase